MFRGTGPVAPYEWLVCDSGPLDLDELAFRHHPLHRLLIACFDSGPISPTEQELSEGWMQAEGGVLSPPLSSTTSIPAEGFDEWWIFADLPEALSLPKYDFFVNSTSWTLRSPKDLENEWQPTWERRSFDWLTLAQEQFWLMLAKHKPQTFISSGDQLVVATTNSRFLDAIEACVNA